MALRKVVEQHAAGVAAEDLPDRVVFESGREHGVYELGEASGVEAGLDRAVEIRAQPDVFDAGDLHGVTDGADDGSGIGPAVGLLEVGDADDAAGRGDAANVVVAQVAEAVAGTLHAGV